jgi:hypothetical protein
MRVGLRFCEEQSNGVSFAHLDRRPAPLATNLVCLCFQRGPAVLSSSVIFRKFAMVLGQEKDLA